MYTLPEVIVVESPASEHIIAELSIAGIEYQHAPPREALRSVQAGWARVLVCPPVPGWRALVSGVDRAGGTAVLFGADGAAGESLPSSVAFAWTPADLPSAVASARTWILQRDTSVLEQGLHERARSAELVSRFAQSIATQIDLPQLVQEAITRARELCDACGASLLLVDPHTGELCFDAVDGGASESIRQIRLAPGQGIAGAVAMRAQPVLISDVDREPLFSSSCDRKTGFDTGSIIAVPLLSGGDVLGVLEAVRQKSREPFTRAHLQRLIDLAPHVCIAVHNAQMTAQLRASQAEVLRANQDLERKVVERTGQLAHAKQEWERTFDAIAEPIALQDGFTLRRVNQAYAERAGHSAALLAGMTCHQALAGRATPCAGCPLAAGRADLKGEVPIADRRFRCSGFAMSEPVAHAGTARTVVMHYRDITFEHALTARLHESERLATVGQLASGAAHEINNPIGFVLSNLSSLKSCVDDLIEQVPAASRESRALLDDSAEMIGEATQGAQRVAAIVKALRELSKQEVSRGDPSDVNASVSRIVRAELNDTVACELDLRATGAADLPPLALDQALAAVLKNARQAVRPGQHVRVRTWTDDRVHVSVTDEGCGISPEHLHRIFEPFFTTRGVGQGIGLGLTVAYGVVSHTGGSIDVDSTPGAGSTFTLHLPLAARPSAPQEDAHAIPTHVSLRSPRERSERALG